MLQAVASALEGAAAMAPRHAVEYAKSERSECKLCGKKIAKGVVRLGFTTRVKGYDTTKWHHTDCYLTTDSNAAAVALAVDANKLEGFPTLKASDQAALKALTSRTNAEETLNGETSDIRSTKNLKDSLGFALAMPQQGTTSQALIGSPDRKRKATSGIFAKLNQDEKEQILRYDPELWETTLKAFSSPLLANLYKGARLPHGWKAFSSVIFNESDDVHPSEKIAAFDFDGCLANTDVRRPGAEAWSLMYPSIPKKLQDYHQEGFKLVIFSNESNIERWTKSRQKAVDSKLGRVEAFIKVAKVPMQAFISCGKEGSGDACRKPSPGMWHLLERHLNGGVPIDKERSFYVGDAAGRKGDHSAADIGFAQAVDLKFFVPEDVFNILLQVFSLILFFLRILLVHSPWPPPPSAGCSCFPILFLIAAVGLNNTMPHILPGLGNEASFVQRLSRDYSFPGSLPAVAPSLVPFNRASCQAEVQPPSPPSSSAGMGMQAMMDAHGHSLPY